MRTADRRATVPVRSYRSLRFGNGNDANAISGAVSMKGSRNGRAFATINPIRAEFLGFVADGGMVEAQFDPQISPSGPRETRMRRHYALFTLLPALAVVSPAPSHAQILSITIAPPALPVYVQPPIPAPGYIWTPGYWAYARSRILLGARHLGAAAVRRAAVDPAATGAGTTASMPGTPAIGAALSASTAASITASAMAASASRAASGAAGFRLQPQRQQFRHRPTSPTSTTRP